VLYNNYYQDELQVWLAYRTEDIAGGADTFDQGVIDGVVNSVSSVSLFGGTGSAASRAAWSRNYAMLLTLGAGRAASRARRDGGWFL